MKTLLLFFVSCCFIGHTRSTIWEEKTHNPRLTKSEEEFVDVMKNLGLAYPNKIGMVAYTRFFKTYEKVSHVVK